MTGQFEYGGSSYDMPTLGAGMMAEGMGAVGADVPLAFRMLENMPSITGMALFNARRFANTMEKGGYRDILDDDAFSSNRFRKAGQRRRARRAGAFMPQMQGGTLQVLPSPSRNRFVFGRARNIGPNTTPVLKQSLGTNFPRLKNLFRFQSINHLSGIATGGAYTPFQGMTILNRVFKNAEFVKEARVAGGLADDAAMFSGGVLGRLSTIGKSYQASLSASKLGSKNPIRAMRAGRAKNTLYGLDKSLTLLGQPQAPGATINQRIAATAGGYLTKNFLEDVATIVDSDLVSKGVRPRNYRPYDPLNPNASQQRLGNLFRKAGITDIDDALNNLSSKSVRQAGSKALRAGERKAAASLFGRYAAAQYAKHLATPVNIIGTAAVVYDLGKMAAQGVVSAGNFAKEAVKSMQGSMRKPLFGMGYQDNEVAATSRSRGVMAIQNSRLNARSMLGSEAGMMAAHFG